eukprot:c54498_g1_i1 orf=143-319(-)
MDLVGICSECAVDYSPASLMQSHHHKLDSNIRRLSQECRRAELSHASFLLNTTEINSP